MSELIRDLPRFHNDCKMYEDTIAKVAEFDEKYYTKLNSMYADFLIKVEAVDRSVEDIVSGFVAVGLQHGTYVDDLKQARLRLDKEIKNAKKLIERNNATT